jgi:hypothetical protein
MLRGFGATTPDWDAVAQQVGLIQSLYGGSEAYASSWLGVGESLVKYVRQRDTWPPSWLHVQRGDQHFVAIEGSTNTWQIGGHIPGVWVRQDFLGDSSVNGGWWEVAQGIKAQLPGMDSGHWHFSGHSYGGAVAGILAMEMANYRGSASVELMTFGAPMYMTNGYQGPLPSPYWRLEATSDFVPSLPPTGVELVGTKWVNPMSWLRTDYLFWEYGSPLILNSKGQVNGDAYDPEANGDLNVIGFPQSHYMSNYWGRLNARRLASGSVDPGLISEMAHAREGFSISTSPHIPIPAPNFMYAPNGEPTPIPLIGIKPNGGDDVAIYNVNLIFVGRNQKTWREGHCVNATTAIEATQKLNNNDTLAVRTAFLSSMYTIKTVEAVNLTNPRDGVVRTGGVQGTVASLKGETAGVAVSLGYATAGEGSQRWGPVRGFPDGYVKWNPDTGVTEFESGVQDLMRAWASKLSAQGAGFYRRKREDPTNLSLAKNYVVSLDGNTTPGLTIITCAAPVNLGTAKGITVHVRGVETRRALPGLSGNYYPAIGYAGNTVTIPYTIPRGGTIAPGAGTYMRPADYLFVGYNGGVEIGSIYARRTRLMR